MNNQFPWGSEFKVVVEGTNEQIMRYVVWSLQQVSRRLNVKITSTNSKHKVTFDVPVNISSMDRSKITEILKNHSVVINP